MMKKSHYRLMFLIAALLTAGSCTSTGSSGATVDLTISNSDIALYYDMVDRAKAEGVEIDADYLYEHYVRKGSAAVHELYARYERHERLEEFWNSFSSNMPFLETNREQILENKNLFSREIVDHVAQKLSSFLDEDFAGTFYFMVGNATMYGTAFDKGIIIDISMTKTEGIDYTDFPLQGFVDYLLDIEDTSFILVHELMHQLQSLYLAQENLTESEVVPTVGDVILSEGGGHFFAVVLLEGEDPSFLKVLQKQEAYFRDNPQLIGELIQLRDTSKENKEVLNDWFFNYGQTEEGVPPDMGYYLGYIIAMDYYNKAEDKTRAFIEIVQYWKNKDKIFDSYIEGMKNS